MVSEIQRLSYNPADMDERPRRELKEAVLQEPLYQSPRHRGYSTNGSHFATHQTQTDPHNSSPIPKNSTLVQRFIHMKCSDHCIACLTFLIGFFSIFFQVLSFLATQWLYVVEPKPTIFQELYVEGERDELQTVTILLLYEAGYWWMCRTIYPQNITQELKEMALINNDTKPACFWNDLNLTSPPPDLMNGGKIVPEIMSRIQFTAILHMLSILASFSATGLAISGLIRKDPTTLFSSIVYICSGLGMAVAVMHYICVVDDEITPMFKANSEGEPSQYSKWFGWSFYVASFSFLTMQMTGLGNLVLFLRRYPSVEDKLKMVPGLHWKIEKAMMEIQKHGGGGGNFSLSPNVLKCPPRSPGGTNSYQLVFTYDDLMSDLV